MEEYIIQRLKTKIPNDYTAHSEKMAMKELGFDVDPLQAFWDVIERECEELFSEEDIGKNILSYYLKEKMTQEIFDYIMTVEYFDEDLLLSIIVRFYESIDINYAACYEMVGDELGSILYEYPKKELERVLLEVPECACELFPLFLYHKGRWDDFIDMVEKDIIEPDYIVNHFRDDKRGCLSLIRCDKLVNLLAENNIKLLLYFPDEADEDLMEKMITCPIINSVEIEISQIVKIMNGDEEKTIYFMDRMIDAGIFVSKFMSIEKHAYGKFKVIDYIETKLKPDFFIDLNRESIETFLFLAENYPGEGKIIVGKIEEAIIAGENDIVMKFFEVADEINYTPRIRIYAMELFEACEKNSYVNEADVYKKLLGVINLLWMSKKKIRIDLGVFVKCKWEKIINLVNENSDFFDIDDEIYDHEVVCDSDEKYFSYEWFLLKK